VSDLSPYQYFIHQSRYARWLDVEGRRETFEESCRRYADFWLNKEMVTEAEAEEIYQSLVKQETCASMRALWVAGPQYDRDVISGYNCASVAVDNPRAFDSALYVLACGTGLGFSVSREHVNKLPEVPADLQPCDTVIDVADSKIGWARAVRELVGLLYAGSIPSWSLEKIRPAGARLKTMGGRASGPEPLDKLLHEIVRIFKEAAGSKLTSIQAHSVMCAIASAIIVGGVRRSALISGSDLSDDRMRRAKMGAFWETDPDFANANNSAIYREKPTLSVFMDECASLYESKSGERGFFNLEAARKKVAEIGRRPETDDYFTNPCGEVTLAIGGEHSGGQCCNLTEVVVRSGDSLSKLVEKTKISARMGTLQATMTDTRWLPVGWKRNIERDALIGCSLTGIMDHPVMSGREGHPKLKKWLNTLRDTVEQENAIWAERLGINKAAAYSTVKPSGTVSQLVDSASGIHPRMSSFYLRRVRQDIKDPLTDFLKEQGVPWEPCQMRPDNTVVFEFPIAAPDSALTTSDVGTMEQIELARIYNKEYCTHQVSCTVYYQDDTFMEAMAYVYKNWDDFLGLSFLPLDDHVYPQAPYSAITKAEYNKKLKAMPDVDWSLLPAFERGDTTEGAKTMACIGDQCEL